MFEKHPLIFDLHKTVIIKINILTITANQRVYFPTDGFLSSKKITGIRLLSANNELKSGSMDIGGETYTLTAPEFFSITLVEKGTGKILIENSPLHAFAKQATLHREIKRVDNLSVSFQDSYITLLQPGAGLAGDSFIFSFYYS